MQRLLYGGQSFVIINDLVGVHFECKKKRVRQRDPLSPNLFLLAVEGLHKTLLLGISKGHFEGLGLVLSHN
jgi:hypothetical protein